MAEFAGKTILITEADGGIGLSTARLLADAGASVVIAGRREDKLEAAVKGIDADDRVLAVPADVTHTADLDRLMNEAQAKFGPLDGVFANARAGMTGHCADCPA
jgi:NAD(P)-dependent dehydrogenase (short-subunit alcohol dehydrogenase family)